MEKFDGTTYRPLTPPEVKQIAGRAGRYGSKFDSGQVTCMNEACLLPLLPPISHVVHSFEPCS